jgi:outer membrane protein W/outer membrane protein OmpA-like peptidoglycan-associated protein
MRPRVTSLMAAALGGALALGAAARADDGHWIARVRGIYIDPANQNDAVAGLVPKDGLEVNAKWAPDVDFEYLVRENVGVELLLTIPQKHSVSLPGVGELGTLKHLPPTLTVKYYFLTGRVRPYVGAGINLTLFSDANFGPLQSVLGGGASVDISNNSFGPALQAGADVALNEHWQLSLDAKKVWISTDVDVNGTRVLTEGIDPWIYGIGVGYRFGGRAAPPPPPVAAAPPPPPPAAAPPPPDGDGDGVIDANDRCPGTPAGATVDANGCELDADNDGVVDRLDQCPGTLAGAKVDARGCEVAEVVLRGVNFETNSATLTAAARAILDGVAESLKQRPDAKIVVAGHTDSVGKDAYNLALSQRRAAAVRDYLISKGINGDKLSAQGYGETRPLASNDTPEGREQNRRVALEFANP